MLALPINCPVLYVFHHLWKLGNIDLHHFNMAIRFNHMVMHAVVCDWITLMNNLFPFCLTLHHRECIQSVLSDTNMSDS